MPNVGDGQGAAYTTSDSWCYGNVSSPTLDETSTADITACCCEIHAVGSIYKCPTDVRATRFPRARPQCVDERLHERPGQRHGGKFREDFKGIQMPCSWARRDSGVFLDEKPISIFPMTNMLKE